jgi:hypothetical protein
MALRCCTQLHVAHRSSCVQHRSAIWACNALLKSD